VKPFRWQVPGKFLRNDSPEWLLLNPAAASLGYGPDLESRAQFLAAAILEWDMHGLDGSPVAPTVETFREYLKPGGFHGLLRWAPDLTARVRYEVCAVATKASPVRRRGAPIKTTLNPREREATRRGRRVYDQTRNWTKAAETAQTTPRTLKKWIAMLADEEQGIAPVKAPG
jgi:hypothetical protein